MRVLDIDLDYFLDNIAEDKSEDGKERLSIDKYYPWNPEIVRYFLGNSCGLSASTPVKGIIGTHHYEAFYFWRYLINSGSLSIPFEVVHIDAHLDTGDESFDWSWQYLLCDILSYPTSMKANPERGNNKMNSGNYLTFAIACRWISKVTYVLHSKSTERLNVCYLEDFDDEKGYLQLKRYDRASLQKSHRIENVEPLSYEPRVPFEFVVTDDYEGIDPFPIFKNTKPFDYIFLSKSPTFTPARSDELIPVILEYIDIMDNCLSGSY